MYQWSFPITKSQASSANPLDWTVFQRILIDKEHAGRSSIASGPHLKATIRRP
ncbi:hypothetical protein GJA_2079 [Janthinobacterium agaricidamnosum NBRC 102515 = DSM 9628]|uniref:Uncharacterized protein n=1 Tax=Janthinobacterium agaricidamnosum NBRC 102515 = DSM 9628 TaxID=1349767 RepID=W0V1K9_9BURK|nr:hypothetical protein GJA_2079 [Janthinobacterium agaricidamnosum NBRC 102515 = DSM 9628]